MASGCRCASGAWRAAGAACIRSSPWRVCASSTPGAAHRGWRCAACAWRSTSGAASRRGRRWPHGSRPRARRSPWRATPTGACACWGCARASAVAPRAPCSGASWRRPAAASFSTRCGSSTTRKVWRPCCSTARGCASSCAAGPSSSRPPPSCRRRSAAACGSPRACPWSGPPPGAPTASTTSRSRTCGSGTPWCAARSRAGCASRAWPEPPCGPGSKADGSRGSRAAPSSRASSSPWGNGRRWPPRARGGASTGGVSPTAGGWRWPTSSGSRARAARRHRRRSSRWRCAAGPTASWRGCVPPPARCAPRTPPPSRPRCCRPRGASCSRARRRAGCCAGWRWWRTPAQGAGASPSRRRARTLPSRRTAAGPGSRASTCGSRRASARRAWRSPPAT